VSRPSPADIATGELNGPLDRPGADLPRRRSLFGDFRVPLHRNGYALVASAALNAALGLLFWLIAARHYSAHALGIQSSAISALLLLSGLAQLSLNNVLVRYVPVAESRTRKLVGIAYCVAVTASVVAGLIFALASTFLSPALHFLRDDLVWLVGFVVATAGWTIFALQDSVLTAMRRTVWVPVENGLVALARIPLLLGLAAGYKTAGIFVAFVAPTLVAVLVVNAYIFGRFATVHVARSRRELPRLSALIRYGFGNYTATIFFLATTALVPLLVVNRVGATATAYFAVPWAIAIALQVVAANFGSSLTVESVLDRAKIRVYARLVLIRVIALVGALVILIFVAAPYVLSALGSDYERQGTSLLRWLAVASLPNALVAVAISVARAVDKAWVVASLQGAGCVVLLVLSYFLLPRMGIEGVGVASLVSQLVSLAVLAGIVWKTRRSRMQRQLDV
jgi:O-antigen/teichoic acid export membrane protein